jgi:hypothetical protein
MVSRFQVDSHTRLPATSTTPPEKRRTTSPIMQIEQHRATDQETQEKVFAGTRLPSSILAICRAISQHPNLGVAVS